MKEIYFRETSIDRFSTADLILIVYQKKDFGIVLIHYGQQQRLKDRSGQSRNTDMALLAKDRIEDMEASQACVLQYTKDRAIVTFLH